MLEFQLPDMTCGHCASSVTKTLRSADPDCQVRIDLIAKTVQVESVAGRQTLAEALMDAGYPPSR